jgi:hypothetical protein
VEAFNETFTSATVLYRGAADARAERGLREAAGRVLPADKIRGDVPLVDVLPLPADGEESSVKNTPML